MIIDLVVGCRPNFVKAAAVIEAAKKFSDIQIRLIHTGQHTKNMSDPFFAELNLPAPSWQMESFNQDPSMRMGDMISGLGAWWAGSPRPNYVMVVGDTDSTLAGTIAAKKAKLKVAHVEAGLRCGMDDMQEEINRKMIDSVSDVLYASTRGAVDNLKREGHMPWTTVFVGNVMVDTLLQHVACAIELYPAKNQPYAMLTLHRAENVDTSAKKDEIMKAVTELAKTYPIIFPMHPRGHVWLQTDGLKMVPPMGYLEFISSLYHAVYVMTDSGGVQEESTVLSVPCVTVRPNTERPETVHQGSNNIGGTDAESIIACAKRAMYQSFDLGLFEKIPELWDGKAAERILTDLRLRP